MGLLTGIAFWLMCTMMWLLATPILVSVISSQHLSGVEGFLMTILPWAVLLALVGRLLASLQGRSDVQ